MQGHVLLKFEIAFEKVGANIFAASFLLQIVARLFWNSVSFMNNSLEILPTVWNAGKLREAFYRCFNFVSTQL